MATLRQACLRLVSFFRKQELDREFDEELVAHVELATQDYISQGIAFTEARRLALVKLGGIELAREVHRESRGLPWLDGVVQDVRYACRALRRSPGFAAIAVATLALGIGANVTVFTLTNALFRNLPFDREDRILYIHSRTPYGNVSYPDFQDWRAQAESFEGMALVNALRISLVDRSGPPESYDATQLSANAFRLLNQRPVIGRDFAPFDETPGASPVAILSYDLWNRRYGRNPAILGQTVRINGRPTTVIGVMAEGFSFPRRQDLWVPLTPTPELEEREARYLWFAFGRMADGINVEKARAEMAAIGTRLTAAYPLTNRGFPPVVQTSREKFIGPRATMIFESLLFAVGFVLLIACANMANLMLARSMGRAREISLRIALGSGRWRIIRQLLIESLMLSSMGGIAGLLMAKVGVSAWKLAAFAPFPSGDSPWIAYTIDYRVVGYLVAISLATGFLFGLAPAGRLARLDVSGALKDGGRGTTAWRGKRLSSLLVIGEISLAVVLLAGAGVMIRSFLNLYTADTGVKTANILTAYLALPDARYPETGDHISFYDRLKTHLEAIPGISSVTVANALPTSPALRRPYELADGARFTQRGHPMLSAMIVGPAYFRTLGVAVGTGRDFTDADDGSIGAPVAIVNQRFASELWPGESAVGKRFRVLNGMTPERWRTVIGVVPNIVQNDRTGQKVDPLVYLPYRQAPGAYMWVLARTTVPPESIAMAFRQAVQALDPDLPIFSLQTLAERLEENYRDNRSIALLFFVFAAIAVLLAATGLYAVIAYSVSQRTQEIGIRMAIGAKTSDILKLAFLQGTIQVGVGLAIGLAAAFAVLPALRPVLVHVSPTDPIVLGWATAVLILVTMLGCLIPARRAMCVDPAMAVRHE